MKDRLRQLLLDQAQSGQPTTYRDLAQRLDLVPPRTIHRVTQALERLMAEDVAAGRPLLAALCVSRASENLPARGFFLMAQQLGVFSGDPDGSEARAFHELEFHRALSFYGGS